MNPAAFKLYLIWCLGAFLSGSIPFGLLLVKLAGKGDVRAQGSGNIGATNVMRAGGKALGIATLLLDAAKGFLPVFIAKKFGFAPEFLAFVALAAVLGHVFTPWLRFQGGKGVATALGCVLAYHAPMVVPAFGAFLLCLLVFRYVSLGSVVAALVLLLTAMGFLGAWARLPVQEGMAQWPILAWALLVGLVIRKHSANINRLVQGTESKFWGSSRNV
ncbi:glycerol-3-phosphate 1-O-acyltransferase PlsY [Mesoterricola silvestris]|uniref:Glycerol-3-phosphate acyltransferase n=1 Tax=Mesoterricola silvestris TaxID=2927979 RepID=A0AA48GK18_9BACT|nr:glycerol-3-phosphate 1-O-acyltransferase PlsY [Mesoterricola silvestris]BDU72624.1 glycerol-3-phosphate acyltransferase [Mesoterricola silvestris]